MMAHMREVLVIGHSHLTAVQFAHIEAGGGTEIEFFGVTLPKFHPESEGRRLHPAIQARIDAAPSKLHVSMLGGNDHCVICLANDPRRFDFVLPEEPDLYTDPQAEIIPASLLRVELKRRITRYLDALEAYRAAVPGRLVHIESPPPVPSEMFIGSHPDTFGGVLAERGVAPALFRYKMWRLHSGLYREACARLGVEFLPVPREMQDEQGMLVQPAWRDATHANTFYGRYVLAQLLAQFVS
jgi:hypothetical protein